MHVRKENILAQEGERIADRSMGCGSSRQFQYEAEKAATEQAAAGTAEQEVPEEKAAEEKAAAEKAAAEKAAEEKVQKYQARLADEAEAKRVTTAVLVTLKGLGMCCGRFHESHISALSKPIEVRTNCFSAYFGMIYKTYMAHLCTVPEFCRKTDLVNII